MHDYIFVLHSLTFLLLIHLLYALINTHDQQYKNLAQSCTVIAKEEGYAALWKGITPRLMRIMPGQAITFMTYEAVSARMDRYGWFKYN